MVLSRYLNNFMYALLIVETSILLLTSCQNTKANTISVSLVTVFDNYFENHSLHTKIGWYKRRILYTYQIHNESKNVVFLPLVANTIDVNYNRKKLSSTIWFNRLEKQKFIILPNQKLYIDVIIDIPSELQRHTLDNILNSIEVSYHKSFLIRTKLEFKQNFIKLYREPESINQKCAPLL